MLIFKKYKRTAKYIPTELYIQVDGEYPKVDPIVSKKQVVGYNGVYNLTEDLYEQISLKTSISTGTTIHLDKEISFAKLAKITGVGTFLVKTYSKFHDRVEYGILGVYSDKSDSPMGSYGGMFLFDLDEYVPLAYRELHL